MTVWILEVCGSIIDVYTSLEVAEEAWKNYQQRFPQYDEFDYCIRQRGALKEPRKFE